MLFGSVPVKLARGRSQIHDRARQVLLGRLREADPRIRRHSLAPATPGQQLVSQRPRRGDSSLDGVPTLPPGAVLETDFQYPGWPAIDVALDTHAPSGSVG